MRKIKTKHDTFKIFDSVAEFAAECEATNTEKSQSGFGGTWEDALALAKAGDCANVIDAQSLLDKLDCEINTEGLQSATWAHNVVGAFPDVPAFLGGEPECMLTKIHERSERNEINIYFSPFCSAGFSDESARERGIAVLALVLALQKIRAVNLYYLSASSAENHVVPIQTNPMIISEAAYAISDTRFFRQLGYVYLHTQSGGWDGHWASWFRHRDQEHSVKVIKECFDLGADDVVIPPVGLYDAISSDPVAWINGILDAHRE
jgi:hypothetical protein